MRQEIKLSKVEGYAVHGLVLDHQRVIEEATKDRDQGLVEVLKAHGLPGLPDRMQIQRDPQIGYPVAFVYDDGKLEPAAKPEAAPPAPPEAPEK